MYLNKRKEQKQEKQHLYLLNRNPLNRSLDSSYDLPYILPTEILKTDQWIME